MRSEVLETTGSDGLILRVEFLWHVDRYRHVISAVEPGGLSIPLLESIEGSLTDDWPPSPPLQSLHVETQQDGRRIALLVGMAGNGHWSASIGPRSDGTGLVFDVASRTGRSLGQLGTGYRLGEFVKLAEIDCTTARLQWGDHALSVEASQEAATRSELEVAEGVALRIVPHALDARLTPTLRWLYQLRPLTSAYRR